MNKKSVKKYRKKPIVIEAYQTDKVMYIETLEGIHKADIGDYIITGVRVNNTHASRIYSSRHMSRRI